MSEQTPPKSILSAELEVIGTIKTSGSVQIDGRVEGEVISQGDVFLGKSGSVKGNLNVNSISVAGTIQGNIIAKDRIELKSTARLMGDIKAKRLAVEDGVTFVGKSEVNPTGQPIKFDDTPAKQPEASQADQGGQSGGQQGGQSGGQQGGQGGNRK
ncbi:MAG: polymer-forming cytoskeletal protein [Verrucomicrobia bacterium]|nr:polymer-forming cytoskeletal protein [Verrucomicrobiota bacterium]MCH8526328.1 polymer-forming cytoskeletal protein [Kiritimatiellia bacterium]